MNRLHKPVLAIFALASVGLAAGCGSDRPEVSYVEGTVTLDGKPLEGAIVTFSPISGGRPSAAKTDSEGWYELTYSRDQMGALPGEHSVSISTFQEGDPDQEDMPAVEEKVPAKYNRKTELKKTVESGSNEIDFKLDTAGEIVEPSEE